MGNPKSLIPNSNVAAGAGAKRPPFDLKERSFDFAVRMLPVAAMLPRDGEAAIVRRQLARSGSSIGANIEEADGASSKADKRKGFVIARKEAREVRYWLRITAHLWGASVKVDADVAEASELVKILSAIIAKMEQSG